MLASRHATNLFLRSSSSVLRKCAAIRIFLFSLSLLMPTAAMISGLSFFRSRGKHVCNLAKGIKEKIPYRNSNPLN